MGSKPKAAPMRASRQLSLLAPPSKEHGGTTRAGRRKIVRPFDPRKAAHLVLKSSRARGTWSLLAPRNKVRVLAIVERESLRFGVRVHDQANVGNHLHLIIKAPTRAQFQNFLRTVTARIARAITGAKKGNPVGAFWDALAYTRVVGLGRELLALVSYLQKNKLEAIGFRPLEITSVLALKERAAFRRPAPSGEPEGS